MGGNSERVFELTGLVGRRHQKAEQFFVEALDKIKRVARGPIPSRWATLWNNLGHARRKLKKFDEALECHNEVSFSTFLLCFLDKFVLVKWFSGKRVVALVNGPSSSLQVPEMSSKLHFFLTFGLPIRF